MSTGDLDFDAPDDGGSLDDVAAGSAATADELARIEAAPLADRAEGYDALADRLRGDLERSDPSRDS